MSGDREYTRARTVRQAEINARPAVVQPDVRTAAGVFAGRFARIVQCDLGTGLAKIRLYRGVLPSGSGSGLDSITVLCQVSRDFRVGDDVLVIPVDAGGVKWAAIRTMRGWMYYEGPEAAELAPVQDNPALDSYCTDTVEP